MAGVSDGAMVRWRTARKARASARDELVVAEIKAGARQRMSLRARGAFVLLAVLAVLAAGLAWWQVRSGPTYSDRELVAAAVERTELLLAADADDPGRAKEILSGATGEFRDSFAQSAEAYTQFVERQRSRGTAGIDAAALAAREGDRGVVLIAASLAVAAGDAQAAPAEAQPLRLRVVVEPADGQLKLAGVTFLP
ncbi:MAG: hypothetical protein WAW85_04010 [Gordonia sp. (in: high G+C Gram-positive bacteria)]|uniref:hypothetical protein n=1 Tax=Gordonia sp. (in: high G+C Gram-positive bacteria) TaxID=84139 RepID=UPI003BB66B7B